MTLAELISMEQLVILMIEKEMINAGIIKSIWGIFKGKNAARRRAAAMIISMMGKANMKIIEEHTEDMLVIGLGDGAKEDLVLAKYACICLQQLASFKNQAVARRPMNHVLFGRLSSLILEFNEDPSW